MTGRHVRWPAERFYWAELDASILPRAARRDHERLGFLLEPLVPCPLDDLHAIYHPLADGRVLACAAECSALAPELESGAVLLTPSALPDFVTESVDVGAMNLLTRGFKPEPVRELERQGLRAAFLALLAAALLVVVGLERRAGHVRQRADAARIAEQQLVGDVLGPASAQSPLPLSLQLEAELRSLRQTRSSNTTVEEPPDAALALAALLAKWPAGVHIQTDSIHVTPESIHVQGSLPTSDAAQELATAVSTLDGWTGVHPTIRRQSGSVRATIQLRREDQP